MSKSEAVKKAQRSNFKQNKNYKQMKIYLTFAAAIFMVCIGKQSTAQTSVQGNVTRNYTQSTYINYSKSGGEEKEYKVAFASGTLNIVDIDELRVEAYDGNEVIISTLVEPSEHNDRSAGLKLVNSLGLDDNTGFGISVTKKGDMLTARQL